MDLFVDIILPFHHGFIIKYYYNATPYAKRYHGCQNLAYWKTQMACVQKEGFDFSFDPGACRRCQGRCCRGASGHVWVSQTEIHQMVLFFESNPVDVIDRYLRRIDNRYAVKEKYDEGGVACLFYDIIEHRCSIYEVRPSQCREFPFWNYFKRHQELLIEECPGVRGLPEKKGDR